MRCHDSRSRADVTCCAPDGARLGAADLCIKTKPGCDSAAPLSSEPLRTHALQTQPPVAVKWRGRTAGEHIWLVQQLLLQLGIDC